MSPRPVLDTIELLRRTLMEVERDLDPVTDAPALAALKRIVMNRIAELEFLQAQQSRSAARSIPPLPSTMAVSAQTPHTERALPDRSKKP